MFHIWRMGRNLQLANFNAKIVDLLNFLNFIFVVGRRRRCNCFHSTNSNCICFEHFCFDLLLSSSTVPGFYFVFLVFHSFRLLARHAAAVPVLFCSSYESILLKLKIKIYFVLNCSPNAASHYIAQYTTRRIRICARKTISFSFRFSLFLLLHVVVVVVVVLHGSKYCKCIVVLYLCHTTLHTNVLHFSWFNVNVEAF